MTDQTYPRARWRLIIDGAMDGATNMAIDEAMAWAAAEGIAPPTLRFYQWDPPCISLGLHQKLRDIDLDACRARGYDIVRRPTGGRAILHTDELTYAVAAPESEPRVAGGVMDAYHRLSQGLVQGLRRLGIPADEAPGNTRTARDVSAACFEVPSAYEICVDGHKLMGSAQRRGRGMVLQHGTLPLYGDLTRIVDCLAIQYPAPRERLRSQLLHHAVTVEQALGRRVPFAEAAQTMAEGFAEALNLELIPGELTETERQKADELRAEKYANPEWTGRVGAPETGMQHFAP